MEPLVSIILLNYNSYSHTLECIASIKKSSYSNYEIIIVDNNSEDDSASYLEKVEDKNIYFIRNQNNCGFAAGNNVGIKLALQHKADFVFLLNNDTIVQKNTLSELVNTYMIFEKQVNIGMVTCLILNYYERDIIWYAGGLISEVKGDAVDTKLGKRISGNMNNSYKNVSFASGCCMLIPNGIFKTCGFLPEKYFLYYEDMEFCKKVINCKNKIIYTNKTHIYHKESISTQKNSPDYVYYYCRNRLQFIKDNVSVKYKICAYLYTFLWIIKKIIVDNYTFKDSFMAVKDFFCNKLGRRV